MAVIFYVKEFLFRVSSSFINNFNCVVGEAELVPITIPQGTFARLSNLIAGGRSILSRLERAGGSQVLP
jgi:hypothetical protein